MSRLLVVDDPSDTPPDSCFQASDDGALPTCTYVDGTWHRSYDDSTGLESDGGVPGFFGVLVVLVIIVGVAGTIWRVSTAQRMARESGMSESDATAMALLTDNGLESTYLASNLRQPVVPPTPPTAPAAGDAAARLQELGQLREQDLITAEEYETRRTAIIDSV
jgi:hypothetical protein